MQPFVLLENNSLSQKLKLYSLEASHKHLHTKSHSLYSFFLQVSFQSQCQTLSILTVEKQKKKLKKKSQSEWKDEMCVVAATLRHSPPTFISPRMLRGPKSSRLTLHTNTSEEEESAFAATRWAVRSSRWVTEDNRASSNITSEHQQTTEG